MKCLFVLLVAALALLAPAVGHAAFLPPGFRFFSSFADQGTYSSATGDWNVGAVSVLATPRLRIVTTVIAGHLVSANTNYAQVSASGGLTRTARPATTRRPKTTTPRSRPRSRT